MSEATKRPWRTTNGSGKWYLRSEIVGADSVKDVANCTRVWSSSDASTVSEGEALANAKLIVSAVNSFDAAVRLAEVIHERRDWSADGIVAEFQKLVDAAGEVLRLAGREK